MTMLDILGLIEGVLDLISTWRVWVGVLVAAAIVPVVCALVPAGVLRVGLSASALVVGLVVTVRPTPFFSRNAR